MVWIQEEGHSEGSIVSYPHYRTKHHPIVFLAFEKPSEAESSFISFIFIAVNVDKE